MIRTEKVFLNGQRKTSCNRLTPEWNVRNVEKKGDVFFVRVVQGQKLEARLK